MDSFEGKYILLLYNLVNSDGKLAWLQGSAFFTACQTSNRIAHSPDSYSDESGLKYMRNKYPNVTYLMNHVDGTEILDYVKQYRCHYIVEYDKMNW